MCERSNFDSSRWKQGMLAVLALCVAMGGCASKDESLQSAASQRGGTAKITSMSEEQVRSEVMSLADAYTTQVAHAMDELSDNTKQREVADWALQNKISTATASLTSAAGPNEMVSLLDMVIYLSLKRSVLEDHWIPVLLHEQGQATLQVYRTGEAQAWDLANRVFTPAQIAELRTLIQQWQADHPGQYYVNNVNFIEFAAYRRVKPNTPQAKPGNLFSLLYIDPLANLDPVAQELRNYRDLTERLAYMAERMPIIFGWQVEYTVSRALQTPEITQFVSATDRFATATQNFQQDLSSERKAAIEQMSDEITKQRQAVWQDVDQREAKIRQLLTESQKLVEQADQAGTSINTQTTKTVTVTEQASLRIMRYAFWLALALVLVIFFCVLATIYARRFWANPRRDFLASRLNP